MTDYLLKQNTALNELQFTLAAKFYKNDIHKIFQSLMYSGLDDNSHGFWIWDIQNEVELYSPKFRSSLQYSGEKDFPSVPASWMQAIDPEDKKVAIANYNAHIETKGESGYLQQVRYKKKYTGYIDVLCYGKVITWKNHKPCIMMGVHLNLSGAYNSKVV